MDPIDFGPIWRQLATEQNVVVMIACGAAMEAFKRGPTKAFAETKWGGILGYYAPLVWCWAALFLPVGLAPPEAGNGAKFMLGVLLATATTSVYDWFFKAVRKMLLPDQGPQPLVSAVEERKVDAAVQRRLSSLPIPSHAPPPNPPDDQTLDRAPTLPESPDGDRE